MKFKTVIEFFKDKDNQDLCPLTNYLIKSGWHQRFGTGYLKNVGKLEDIPSQYNHLMNYCKSRIQMGNIYYPYTPCGELVFWMAEVSGTVENDCLKALANRIITSNNTSRKYWNTEIKNICWEAIKKTVNNSVDII